MSTGRSGNSGPISARAEIPSRFGIMKSRISRSGARRRTAATHSSPSAVSSTATPPSSRTARRNVRMPASSSQMWTRNMSLPPFGSTHAARSATVSRLYQFVTRRAGEGAVCPRWANRTFFLRPGSGLRADRVIDGSQRVCLRSCGIVRSYRVVRRVSMQEPSADKAGHVGVRPNGLGGIEGLFCVANRSGVGLTCRRLALVLDAADSEDDDGGQDAEDDDDYEEFDEGETALVVPLLPEALNHF